MKKIYNLPLESQASYFNFKLVNSYYDEKKSTVKHIVKINAQLYKIYRKLIEKDPQFSQFEVAFGYLVRVILNCKYKYFDYYKDFIQYAESFDKYKYFINGGYVSSDDIISSIDLFYNYEKKDSKIIGDYIKFCKSIYKISPLDTLDLDKEMKEKINRDYKMWHNETYRYKGYKNYTKIKSSNNAYSSDVSIIINSLQPDVFNECYPGRWCIDYVFANKDESYIVKVFRDGKSLSKTQCEYFELLTKTSSQKVLCVNFIPS
jgi:hypothetical protein